MVGSSVALSISDIPFCGPTGSVIVGYVDGQYIINPNTEQREKSRLHLFFERNKEAILMVEAGANELTEEEMIGAILFGHEEIKKIALHLSRIFKSKSARRRLYQIFIIRLLKSKRLSRLMQTRRWTQCLTTSTDTGQRQG